MSDTTKDPRDLFAPLLEWLDAGAPPTALGAGAKRYGFSMKHFYDPDVTEDREGRPCDGTVCLATALGMIHRAFCISTLMGSYGIAYDAYYDLTFPSKSGWGWTRITPDMAARTIRHLIETGKTDWKAVNPPEGTSA